MKKIALVLTGAFLSVATMGAMANNIDNIVIESNYDGKKSKVEKDELPQEVIKSLEESDYKAWEVKEAYKVENEQTNEVHYELHLASASDAQMIKNVKFSEVGEIISEEDSELGRTEDENLETQPEFEGIEPGMQETEPGIEGVEPGAQPESGQPGTETPAPQY